jgi:hypothetical protein
MSQSTTRHGSHARSEDEDVVDPQPRQPERQPERRPGVRLRRPVGQPAGGVGPDEPDEGEFELIGDNDLSPADLGPVTPTVSNPDAESGRPRQ